jgi:1-acyl-sn-glycerol-3-phosphate acyltransferase
MPNDPTYYQLQTSRNLKTMNAIIRFFLRLCFGFRAFNTAALNAPGPVMLLAYHVSWFDWLFLGKTT